MYIKTFENFSNIVIGYRSLNNEYTSKDGIQYFASSKSYSKRFGANTIKRNISLDNACFLENWNTLLRNAGHKDFGGQGLLTISSEYLNENGRYFEYGDFQHEIFRLLGLKKLAEFLKELRTADVIVGEDAGHPNEIVYAVRNKSAISEVEL